MLICRFLNNTNEPNKTKEEKQMSLVTFLDHFCQVRLSEDFGHPEDHQRIFGIHQIGPDRSVQKHLEELGVHEQVLMNKGLPA